MNRIARLFFLLVAVFAALAVDAHAARKENTIRLSDLQLPPVPFEVALPEGGDPRGVVVLVHGGGWFSVGEAAMAAERANAARYRADGWATVNIDYRPGAASVMDTIAFTDWAQVRFAGLPVCLSGTSAGGHLSLLAAAARPNVDCVISHAGPTDLTTLHGTPWTNAVRDFMAVPAFGADYLDEMSPVTYATRTQALVLLSGGVADLMVPHTQMDAYQALKPSTELVKLPVGLVSWVHAFVTSSALTDLWVRESLLLDRAARRHDAARPATNGRLVVAGVHRSTRSSRAHAYARLRAARVSARRVAARQRQMLARRRAATHRQTARNTHRVAKQRVARRAGSRQNTRRRSHREVRRLARVLHELPKAPRR